MNDEIISIWLYEEKFELPATEENKKLIEYLKKEKERHINQYENHKNICEKEVRRAKNEIAYLKRLIGELFRQKPEWETHNKDLEFSSEGNFN